MGDGIRNGHVAQHDTADRGTTAICPHVMVVKERIMANKKLLNPDWPRVAGTDFAQGVQVGDTVYVSGQCADPEPNGSRW